jgi:NTE family protein
VHDVVDAIGNFWAVSWARAPITVEVSPYLYDPPAEPKLQALLAAHLDLEHLTADRARRALPKLLIGATEVMNGDRVIFEGESLTTDDLIASAAVPPLFRAKHANGGHLYWDGLFATNPPVREFTDLTSGPTRSGSCRSIPSAATASRAACARSSIAGTSWRATCRSARSCISSTRSIA